jgi:hypothetical protein
MKPACLRSLGAKADSIKPSDIASRTEGRISEYQDQSREVLSHRTCPLSVLRWKGVSDDLDHLGGGLAVKLNGLALLPGPLPGRGAVGI